MNEMTMTIIGAVLASNGAFALLQFLITRHDTRKNLKGTLLKLEKDGLRTQMLVMIFLRPKEKKEILTLAERYFSEPPKGLGANWYMTDIFKQWLEDEGHSKPEWFKAN